MHDDLEPRLIQTVTERLESHYPKEFTLRAIASRHELVLTHVFGEKVYIALPTIRSYKDIFEVHTVVMREADRLVEKSRGGWTQRTSTKTYIENAANYEKVKDFGLF